MVLISVRKRSAPNGARPSQQALLHRVRACKTTEQEYPRVLNALLAGVRQLDSAERARFVPCKREAERAGFLWWSHRRSRSAQRASMAHLALRYRTMLTAPSIAYVAGSAAQMLGTAIVAVTIRILSAVVLVNVSNQLIPGRRTSGP